MKTMIKRVALRMLFFVCLLSALLFTIMSIRVDEAVAVKAQFTGADFLDEYELGHEVILPDIKAVFDGKEYATEKAIILPDGTCKSVSKEVLDKPGRYVAVYSAVIDGFKYEERYYFSVNEKLFDTERRSGTAVYDEEKDCIALHLDANNAFVYNTVVDLSDNDLSAPFLEMYNVSSMDGERDFETIIVTLTDTDDENNYINIRINASDGFGQYPYTYHTSYVAVGIKDGAYKGQEGSGIIHVNNNYGRPVRFSFCNMGANGATPENDRLQLFYDAETKQMVVYSTSEPGYGGIIVDFDDDVFYKEFWEGFSVGKCRLSLYATAMKKATADIFVTNIDGHDLSLPCLVDNEGPEIIVNAPENVPYGITGYGYKIHDYSVRDDYGVSSSTVSAYYAYYSDFPVSVSIDGGEILPAYPGVYTLVYKAEDKYGNTTVKTTDIIVDNEAEATPIGMTITGDYANCLAGTKVLVNGYNVSADEKYGGYTVKITATCGNTAIDLTNAEYFYANAVGEWKVSYEATDNFGRKAVAEKRFTAAANPDPVFGEPTVSLPKYLLSGNSYKLPDIKAYRYGQTTEEITPSIKYTLNGKNGNIADGTIIPDYENGKDNIVVVTYYVGAAEWSFERRVAETLAGDELRAAGMFSVIEGNASTLLGETGIVFNAATDAVIDFVNPVLSDAFALEFNMLSNGEFTVNIEDESDSSQKLRIRFERSGGTTVLYINDKRTDAYERADFTVSLRKDVLNVNSSSYNVKTYSSGRSFAGFSSMKTLVSFSLASGTGVRISRVSNQPISDYNEDVIDPTILVDGSFDAYYKKGDSIIIPRAYAIDTVCGQCEITVTVRANGEYLRATDGTLLKDYAITNNKTLIVEEYGQYSVVYKAKDRADNEYKVPILISVPDDIKPEINVKGEIKTEAVKGEKITLPTAEATDNISEDLKVTVITIAPGFIYETVSGNEVMFTKAGRWIVRYFVKDEAGNMTIKDYMINVKEK